MQIRPEILIKNQNDDLVGGNFISRQRNGHLLTTDSMKSREVKIEKESGIHFKFRNLRYTHASFLAVSIHQSQNYNIGWDTRRFLQFQNTTLVRKSLQILKLPKP